MTLRYIPNVVTLQLTGERCIGCGTCAVVCPHGVFSIDGSKARIVDRDACMECGACAKNCPVDAIAVQSGVGCATAILAGALAGTEPCCGSPDGPPTSCCG